MRVSYLHAMECFPSMLRWLIGFLVESSRYTEQYVFVLFESHISLPDVLIQDSFLTKSSPFWKCSLAQYIETFGEFMFKM